MKNLLLIQPSLGNSPIGYRSYSPALGILAHFLKSEYDITILDLLIDDSELTKLDFSSFDMVALTLLTPAVPSAEKIIKILKKRGNKLPIIAGGSHATFLPYEVLTLGFDYVISGRTGSNILPIVDSIIKGQQREKIISATLPDDEDLSICLDYFDLSKYSEHIFFTSIGCPYKCIFCSNNYFNIYRRDIDKVCQEVATALVKKKMPIFFSDDVFFTTDEQLKRFCHSYASVVQCAPFTIQLRADQVTPERVEMLAAAGCQRIVIGVESGSDATLTLFHKQIRKKDITEAIRIIEGAKIKTRMNYIIGMMGDPLPENNLKNIAETSRPSEISIHQLIPFPGSKLWIEPERYGIEIKNKKAYGDYNFSTLSNNFTYAALRGRTLREVLDSCINNLVKLGYTEPGASPVGPYLVTPLSSVRFTS